MVEHEKKFLLTQDEYNLLMDHFKGGISSTQQTNYYFDTDSCSMNQNNITCRIRYKNKEYKGTFKIHIPSSDESIEIDVNAVDSLEHNGFTEMGLKLKGYLNTYRVFIEINDRIEIVVDKNTYLGYTDYELEIEYRNLEDINNESCLNEIVELLESNFKQKLHDEKSPLNTCLKSKAQRFFKRMMICKLR